MCRRAKYSLDEDNKRDAQARADEWHERADILTDEIKEFNANLDGQKYYRPVCYENAATKSFVRKIKNETITVSTHKTTGVNDIYLSDKVKLKRKEFHTFDKNITEAYKMLGETKAQNKPAICILSPSEMKSYAVGSYDPIKNVLNINSAYFKTDNLAELQKDLVCPDNPLSTILHELIHWQDAESYRQKFGAITDYQKYCDYLNKIYKPKVEKLLQKGYNISEVSEYAFESLKNKVFDEVYNEYRIKQLLGW